MVSFFFLSLAMLVGVNMAFTVNDVNVPKHHVNRIFRSHEQLRALRNIMGKLIDTESNTIYSIDGQKQRAASASHEPSTRFIEDLACLEACYKCVEDYPQTMRKKKAADNCGPMCDCADSCSRMPIEQIDKTYGQGAATRGDKGCFWKTYSQLANDGVPSTQ